MATRIDADRERARRLRAAQASERLAVQLGEEIDAWMQRRGETQRSLAVTRSSLNRCLTGQDVRLSTVAQIAEALRCDAVVQFQPWPDDAGESP